jgi:hypothetical protein
LVSVDNPPRQSARAAWFLKVMSLSGGLTFRHTLESEKITVKTVFGTQKEQRVQQITESAQHLRLGASFSNHPKHALNFAPNVAISWK